MELKNNELCSCLRNTVLLVGHTLLLIAANIHNASAQDGSADTTWQFSFKWPIAQKEVGCCKTIGMPANDTGGKRVPALIGIGVEKCGSTYLAELLKLHPKMQMSWEKEVHFMDTVVHKERLPSALKEYLDMWQINKGGESKPDIQLFEVTPNYIYIPSAACRSKTFFPNVKFVVVLRDPADRAYSQYTMFRNVQCPIYKRAFICPYKNQKFYDVVQEGIALLGIRNCTFNTGRPLKGWNECFGCLINDMSISQYCHGRWYMFDNGPDNQRCHELASDMVSRGLYAAQIAWWFQHFPPDRFLFINSNELFEDPVRELNRVVNFVGLDVPFTSDMLQREQKDAKNTGDYGVFNDFLIEETKEVLRNFYRKPNEDLYELLRINGHNFTRFEDAGSRGAEGPDSASEEIIQVPEDVPGNETVAVMDTAGNLPEALEDVAGDGAEVVESASENVHPEYAQGTPSHGAELMDIVDVLM